MKERSHALLASAVLAVGSAAAAVAAEPPLKTLPSQQDIWITGTIRGATGSTRRVNIRRSGWTDRQPRPATTRS